MADSTVRISDPNGFREAAFHARRISDEIHEARDIMAAAIAKVVFEVRVINTERAVALSSSIALLIAAEAKLAACAFAYPTTIATSCAHIKIEVEEAKLAVEGARDLLTESSAILDDVENCQSQKAQEMNSVVEEIDRYLIAGSLYLEDSRTSIIEYLRQIPKLPELRSETDRIGNSDKIFNGIPSKTTSNDQKPASEEIGRAIDKVGSTLGLKLKYTGTPKVTRSENYAGTWIMRLDTMGTYEIRSSPFKGDGFRNDSVHGAFHPYYDLLDALYYIEKQQALSFNQEHAIQSLWHEMTHDRSTMASSFLKNIRNFSDVESIRTFLEVLTEFYARETYPQAVAALGGKASHAEEIRRFGYGYHQSVENLYLLLSKIGMSIESAVPLVERYLVEIELSNDKAYKNTLEQLAIDFKSLSGRPINSRLLATTLAAIDERDEILYSNYYETS